MGDGLWHRDVAERHEAAAPVDAPGDQEAAAAPADVAERGDDPGAGAVVISRLDDPLDCARVKCALVGNRPFADRVRRGETRVEIQPQGSPEHGRPSG